METNELYLYNETSILNQLQTAPYRAGCYELTFYVHAGLPSAEVTDTTAVFYLYPSGGTLRDAQFNIITYSARFDTYRGFVPPHSVR